MDAKCTLIGVATAVTASPDCCLLASLPHSLFGGFKMKHHSIEVVLVEEYDAIGIAFYKNHGDKISEELCLFSYDQAESIAEAIIKLAKEVKSGLV